MCRQLRTFSDCYVLMLTARADEVDKLIGLSVGADDYMTKPFSPRELVARIQVLLRRPRAGSTGATAAGVHRIGALTLDPSSRRVELDASPVELTRTEFDLLQALAEHPGWVLNRRQLTDAVWGEEGSSPSFLRRCAMCTSTRWSSPTQSSPHTASVSWRRFSTPAGC